MSVSKKSLALGVGAALCLPAAAQAATKTVDMGVPANSQKALQKLGADVNAFFPTGATIHVGDSIKFVPTGFHTAEFPKRGASPTPLISPTGQLVSGSNDAAGNPFWFNGKSNFAFTPSLLSGSLGKKVSFNGSKTVSSGLPLANKPKPMTVKFTKTGSFTFYCNIHEGMKGKVTVVAKNKSIPSKKVDAKAVATQVKSAKKIAKTLPKKNVPSGTVDVGVAGPQGVEFYDFLPKSPTIPVGTTLNFRMSPGSREVHTATTGPGNPQTEPNSYLGGLSQSINGPAPDARAVYPSDAPGAPASLTPTFHGNGFWNAGVLSNGNGTIYAANNSVKFAAAGTYQFYCLIHPFMHGTITVK